MDQPVNIEQSIMVKGGIGGGQCQGGECYRVKMVLKKLEKNGVEYWAPQIEMTEKELYGK